MRFRSRFLFPVLTLDVPPLALRPLLISGMSTPVVGGDGGINNATLTDYASGMFCAINAYSAPIRAGDKLAIFWGDELIFTREVTPAEDGVNEPLFFFLPIDRIVPGWVDKVYYELTRAGDTTPDDSAVPLRLLVKLTLPGGRDNDPHLPGHSKLLKVQLPKDVIDNGVDAEWAQNGVPMTIAAYENIAVRDVVQVRWGSVYVKPHTVTAAQAAGTDPIVITADQDEILAGGDSNNLLLHYQVHDEVWNYSEKWSMTTTVKVEAGAWRLEPPIIKESLNGFIDLEALNKADVHVQIRITSAEFAIGDTVTMTWIGTPPTGKPLIHVQSRPVANIPSILEIPVPYEDIRAIAMGTADVAYVLYKNSGAPPLSSKRAFAQVVGAVSLLPEPLIREVRGDTLQPDEPVATVEVHYPGMADGDLVDLIWLGMRSNGLPYPHEAQYLVSQADAESKLITLYVAAEHISILENGTLDLSYRVSNDQYALHGVSESERLLVNVGRVRATLPVPRVLEADPPDILDPAKVREIVTVHVPYLGTVAGDTLTYYWRGTNELTSTEGFVPITTVIEGQTLNFRVGAYFVAANIGTYVKVSYTLKHAGTQRYSYSATLDLLVGFPVGELPRPTVIQATAGALDPMNALGGVDINITYTSMDAALDVVGLRWIGTPGGGTSDSLELPGHSSGSVQFHLPPSIVGYNIDRDVSVSYFVRRYGLTTPSQTLDLKVLNFQDPPNQLPRPQVPQAVGGVLDLMTFSGDPRVTVMPWPFIAVGQRIWLRVSGETTAGDEYTITLLDGWPLTQANSGLNEVLPRSEVMRLRHSSRATAVCKVTFDASGEEFAAVEFPPTVLTIRTRYDYVTPQIRTVTDPAGDVPNNGLTRYSGVTVSGTATREETVELLDGGAVSLGTAVVGVDSTWRRTISPLTEKPYIITAKALYDANPVSSEPRAFTVEFGVTPQILRVIDSTGPVAPGGSTFDTVITVGGTASTNEQIQLWNNTTPLYTVNVDNRGEWQQVLSNLTPGTHSLTAKALYYPQPVSSPPRIVVVVQTFIPRIDSVIDDRGELVEGNTTYSRTLTLSGVANRNERIELRDGINPVTTLNVDSAGTWRYSYPGLQVKSYSLTVKALYGSQPVSTPPRTFTVAAHIAPTLTSVTDSTGPVAPGGITYDSSVTAGGAATPRERVQIFNGSTPLGTVTAGNDTQWTLPLNGLTPGTYTLTAKALYNVTPDVSQPRAFSVAVRVTPTLDSVTDAHGEVVNGSRIYNRTVTLRGTASKNERIELLDGTNLVTTLNVDSAGGWSYSYPGLQLKSYNLTVKALYGSQPVSTPPRTFTVAAHIAPTLTSVTDSTGPVAPGGITYDSSVTAGGAATPRERVQIFNNSTPLGTTTVGVDQQWTLRLNSLTPAAYRLTAKALYDVTPDVSEPRAFTVGVIVGVSVTNVRDSRGEVLNNGTTTETVVSLQGGITANQQVQIFDGGVGKHNVTAVGTIWNTTLSVGLGAHVITARSVSTGQVSNSRSFTVLRALSVDPSPLILNGLNYTINGAGLNWVRTGIDPTGTSGSKAVSGGQPPYTFSSSAPTIASVDDTGLVRSEGNGNATITVGDRAGSTVSFPVAVSNVKQILVNHQQLSWAQAAAWIASVGATQIDSGTGWQTFSTVVRTKYRRGPAFVTEFYFTGGRTGTNSWGVSTVANDAHPEGWIYLSFSAIATLKAICVK